MYLDKIILYILILLALYISFTYIYYYIMTRNIGTPFKDNLHKYPKLKKIYDKSVEIRSAIFYKGTYIFYIIIFIILFILYYNNKTINITFNIY